MFAQAAKKLFVSTKKPSLTLHKYWDKSVKFILRKPESGLFLDPGLGKTSIILKAFKILQAKGSVDILVVLATSRVMKSTWPKEIEKWEDFKNMTYTVLHGPKKDDGIQEECDVYLLNYEGLPWFTIQYFKYWKGKRKIMFVCDESSHLKSTSSLRFKILKGGKKGKKKFKALLNEFSRRHILTGTPAPNNLGDIFSQIYVLDLGDTFGKYITKFRTDYMMPVGHKGYQWEMIRGSEKIIYNKIKPLILRFSDAELDLPPLVYRRIDVELSDKTNVMYKQMEEEFVLELKSGENILAESGASASNKLRQIVGGNIYNGIGKDRTEHMIHVDKILALKELVDELQGQPLLVAYEFNHELRLLMKYFPGTKYIGGGVSLEESFQIEDDWNAGKIQLLFGQITSVAYGLNLQEGPCSNIAFYTLTWKLSDYLQFIRRIWRQGQKNKVIVHHLIAQNTVDETVLRVLRRKDITQKDLLDAMQERYLLENTMTTTIHKLHSLAEHINTSANDIVPITETSDESVTNFVKDLIASISDMNVHKIEDFLYDVLNEFIDARIADKTVLMEAVQDGLLGILDLRKKGGRYIVDPKGKTQDLVLELNSKLNLKGKTMSLKPSNKPSSKGAVKAFTPSTGKESYLNPDKKKSAAKKAPAKKTVTKKAPAKKTVAKKAPAKKTVSKSTKMEVVVTSTVKQASKGIMASIQKHVGKKKLSIGKIIAAIKLDHPKKNDKEFIKYYVLAALRNGFLKETK